MRPDPFLISGLFSNRLILFNGLWGLVAALVI